MDKELITKLNNSFEATVYEQNGVEYWLARELQVLLEYEEWRNFFKVIEKAMISCQNAGQNPGDHFVDVNKTIPMPKGGWAFYNQIFPMWSMSRSNLSGSDLSGSKYSKETIFPAGFDPKAAGAWLVE